MAFGTYTIIDPSRSLKTILRYRVDNFTIQWTNIGTSSCPFMESSNRTFYLQNLTALAKQQRIYNLGVTTTGFIHVQYINKYFIVSMYMYVCLVKSMDIIGLLLYPLLYPYYIHGENRLINNHMQVYLPQHYPMKPKA